MSANVNAMMPLWKAKAARGELSEADCIEAMRVLRGDRYAAQEATQVKRTAKAKAAVPSADDMLNELEGL